MFFSLPLYVIIYVIYKTCFMLFLKRGEKFMKRKIIAALIATLAITQAGIGFTGNMGKVHAMNPNQYTDVVSTNVNYSYIEKMVDEGIMDAETENEFGAEKAMTRQGLLTALYRMEKNPLVLDGENTFADVDYKADNELGRALKWAENSNLFAGLNEGFFAENKFEADKSLSKQETVQIVFNYAKYKNVINTNAVDASLDVALDRDSVADWAQESMKWALVNQFVDVDKEQKINPEKEITKEETAKILAMYLDMEERIENERNLLATTPQNTPVSNTENNSTTNDNTTQESGQTGTETPEIPLTPIEPSTPVEPENPSIPLEPSTPVEKPSIPLIPLEPSIPVEPENPDKPHEHHWVDNIVKIEHPEEGHYEKVLVKDAWDEEVPIYEEQIRHICNNCGEDITGSENDHMFEHLSNGELAGWHEEVKNIQVGTETVHHEAVYEDKWIVDKEAWTETIHHEAVYENKWIVDKEAWTEEVVQGQICPDCGATRK